MSKDRKWIAKGVPRNRYLIELSNKNDKKRILTYSSEGMAKAAFSNGLGFYGGLGGGKDDLEAVQAEIILNIN